MTDGKRAGVQAILRLMPQDDFDLLAFSIIIAFHVSLKVSLKTVFRGNTICQRRLSKHVWNAPDPS